LNNSVLTLQGLMNTDQQLLSALAAGERKATSLIYNQHFHIVNGWLVKNGGSANDAADLFQEAMVVLFGKAQDPDFRLTSSIGTYLMAVCKHLWYKKLALKMMKPAMRQKTT
jgi:DNA-directed RNA polymerase specialized sigma24 family protein